MEVLSTLFFVFFILFFLYGGIEFFTMFDNVPEWLDKTCIYGMIVALFAIGIVGILMMLI